MGMYDYIKCELPLPITELMPDREGIVYFQTKDTPDQYLKPTPSLKQGSSLGGLTLMRASKQVKRIQSHFLLK